MNAPFLPPIDKLPELSPLILSRYASIVESSEDAIVSKDLDGTVVTWNHAAYLLYGYTAAEIVGRSIKLLADKDRLEEEEQILARIRVGERVHHFETIRIRKDGVPVHVSLMISPIRDQNSGQVIGASHVARDISERKRLEAANAHLAAVVESSDDAIISKSLEGTIVTWNAAAERIYGYPPQEAIGQKMLLLIPTDRVQEEVVIRAKIARGEEVSHFETKRTKKGGTTIDVSLTISPIRDP